MTQVTGMNDANGGRGELRGFIHEVELSVRVIVRATLVFKDRDTNLPRYELLAVPHTATTEVLAYRQSSHSLAYITDLDAAVENQPQEHSASVHPVVPDSFMTGARSRLDKTNLDPQDLRDREHNGAVSRDKRAFDPISDSEINSAHPSKKYSGAKPRSANVATIV
ncbi:hypothetical protein C8R45DRAFT_1040329 [Mycena sanguinolenta]|nr:hypothetical protein C8R45DRAFT_1040329 [Mycena sanguinolenta]